MHRTGTPLEVSTQTQGPVGSPPPENSANSVPTMVAAPSACVFVASVCALRTRQGSTSDADHGRFTRLRDRLYRVRFAPTQASHRHRAAGALWLAMLRLVGRLNHEVRKGAVGPMVSTVLHLPRCLSDLVAAGDLFQPLGMPSRAYSQRRDIGHLPPDASTRRCRSAPEGRPQPTRPPRQGARLPHPPCLRPVRVTVICPICGCSLSSPDAPHRSRERSLRRGAGAPPPPPTGRRWGHFLGAPEREQQPMCLELSLIPPS